MVIGLEVTEAPRAGGRSARRALQMAIGLSLLACQRDGAPQPCEDAVKAENPGEILASCGRELAALLARSDSSPQRARVPRVLRHLGLAHNRQGNQAAAEEHLGRALREALARKDDEQAALAAYAQFSMHWRRSSYLQALAAIETAHELSATRSSPTFLRRLHFSVFDVLLEVGHLSGARAAFEVARALMPPDAPEWPYVWLKQGALEEAEGDPLLALQSTERALQAVEGRENTSRSLRWALHLNAFTMALAAGRREQAEQQFVRLERLRPLQVASNRGSEIAFLATRARRERALGQAALARRTLAEAVALGPTGDWSVLLAVAQGEAAEEDGDDEAARAAYQRAIAALESLRAQVVGHGLQAVLLTRKVNVFGRLLSLEVRRGRPLAALAAFEASRSWLVQQAVISRTEGGAPDPGSLPEALRAARFVTRFMPALRSYPVLRPPPVPELLASLAGKVALLYFENGEELFALSIARGRITARRLPAAVSAVRNVADKLLVNPDDRAAAEQLGSMILPPDLPVDDGGLLVSPSETIARVPFAALRRRERFLVQDTVLAQTPSLTAFHLSRQPPARSPGPPMILTDAGADLPAAAAEGLAVGRTLAVAPFTARAATRERLRAAASASVLHLAAHTGIGARGPWLALAEGPVFGSDILEWALAPRLVVLASCASGLTLERGLWGSLAMHFLAAGAGAVVGSLRSVPDGETAAFIRDLYAANVVATPALALARTQRAWIAAARPPSRWAHFGLYGAGDPLPARP